MMQEYIHPIEGKEGEWQLPREAILKENTKVVQCYLQQRLQEILAAAGVEKAVVQLTFEKISLPSKMNRNTQKRYKKVFRIT